MTMLARIRSALEFIRFSHTLFALPFALGAMLAAADGIPGPGLFALILLALVFARTAAMSFNRLVDWEIDRRNPRTAGRHRLISYGGAVVLCAGGATAFVGVTWFINTVCFLLSPVALALIFFYSLTKRFTHFTQIFLGLALAAAPVGAWLAVDPALAWPPLILALGVLFWVAGFDLIYATQDVEFDRRENLKSMVVWLGVERALRLAMVWHGVMWICLLLFGLSLGFGMWYHAAMVLIAGVLLYEHRTAVQGDLDSINRAFFLSNALVGVIFLAAVLVEVW